MQIEKRCPRCERTLPAAEYRVRSTGFLEAYCRDCARVRTRLDARKRAVARRDRADVLPAHKCGSPFCCAGKWTSPRPEPDLELAVLYGLGKRNEERQEAGLPRLGILKSMNGAGWAVMLDRRAAPRTFARIESARSWASTRHVRLVRLDQT